MKDRILQIIHNVIAHPVMEILSWVGLNKLGAFIHNKTVPDTWSL